MRLVKDWLFWYAAVFAVLGFVQGGLLGVAVDLAVFVLPVYAIREYLRARRRHT